MASTDAILLDLDAEQRPVDQVKPPFTFNWHDRVITLTDPAELTYDQLLQVEQPAQFLRFCASQEDRDFLASSGNQLEGWRLGVLLERFFKHFGYDPEGRAEKERRNKLGY